MELQELYGLMERFAASGLTELEWQKKDERVCLRRAPAQVVQAAPAAAPAAPAPAAPKACLLYTSLLQLHEPVRDWPLPGPAVRAGAPVSYTHLLPFQAY